MRPPPPKAAGVASLPNQEDDAMSQITVDKLSRSVLLEVFDEQDSGLRDQAIARLFTPDVVFIDHNGARDGQGQIKSAVEHSTPHCPASASPIAASPAFWTEPLNSLGNSDRRLIRTGSRAQTPSYSVTAA